MSLWLFKLTLVHWLIICLKLLHVARCQYNDNADLLCTQLLNTQLLERCCGDSKASNLPFVNSNCGQYKDDYGACRYECIFDHWHLLNPNKTLIMSNIGNMVSQLYPTDSDYHSYSIMLFESFEHCEILASTYTGVVRLYATLSDPETGVNSDGVKCNKNAMIYFKCTIANMFLNCPSKHWREKDNDCQAGQRLLNHCVKFLNDIDDANMRGKLRSTNSAPCYKLKNRSRQGTHWFTTFVNWLVF